MASLEFSDGLLDLVHLGLRQTLDLAKFLLGVHLEAADGADSGGFQLLEVGHVDTVSLEAVDVDDEVFVVGVVDVDRRRSRRRVAGSRHHLEGLPERTSTERIEAISWLVETGVTVGLGRER